MPCLLVLALGCVCACHVFATACVRRRCALRLQESLDSGMAWFGRIVSLTGNRSEGFVGFNDDVIRVVFQRMRTWLVSLAETASPTPSPAASAPSATASTAGSATGTATAGASSAVVAASPGHPPLASQPSFSRRFDTVPSPVTLSSLSPTVVRVFLQYLLETNVNAGGLKVKRVTAPTAPAPATAGVTPSATPATDASGVDVSMQSFPINGVKVFVTSSPQGADCWRLGSVVVRVATRVMRLWFPCAFCVRGWTLPGNVPYIKRAGVDVIGLEELWSLALATKSPQVGSAVTSFLVAIHTKCVLRRSLFPRRFGGPVCRMSGSELSLSLSFAASRAASPSAFEANEKKSCRSSSPPVLASSRTRPRSCARTPLTTCDTDSISYRSCAP